MTTPHREHPHRGTGSGTAGTAVAGSAIRVPAVVALIAVTVAAFGAPLGWLWATLAPRVPLRMVDGGLVPVDPQPEQFIAADGWFTLLGAGFGGLAAAGVWLLGRRFRGPVGLVALTLGTVGAGLLAWWLGHRIGLADYRRAVGALPVGAMIDRPPDLRAGQVGWWFGAIPRVQGDLLVPALVAVVGYTMVAAWSRYPSLRREEATAAEGSGGVPAADGGVPAADGEPDNRQASGSGPAVPDSPAATDGPPAAGQFELGGPAARSDSGTGTART